MKQEKAHFIGIYKAYVLLEARAERRISCNVAEITLLRLFARKNNFKSKLWRGVKQSKVGFMKRSKYNFVDIYKAYVVLEARAERQITHDVAEITLLRLFCLKRQV